MVDLKVRYEGQWTRYYCPEDGTLLAMVHESGSGQIFSPCPHYEVSEFGNLYYELNASQLNEHAVLRVWSGTTVYILYPKSQ
jgi:hypothetical protein